jgi:hypothetical protein
LKKIFFFLLIPIFTFGQIDKAIKLKVAVIQNFVHKGIEGETMFWQTKGKITFGIVNYTNEQNPIFKELFIKQYQEILPIYNKMIVSEDENDAALFIKTLIKQEDDYRALLTPEQLQKYSNQLADFEKNNQQANDSYSSLFFSDNLLSLFKKSFSY